MLKETTALDFWAFREDYDIDNVISIYQDLFCENLVKIFHQLKIESEERPVSLETLQNYTVFHNLYPNHKNITYNSKNLIFETCVGCLWDRFKLYLERQKDKRGAEDPYDHERLLSDIMDQGTPVDQITLYKPSEYNAFFGSGEFPVMIFSVIRVGTREYSFWDIAR